MAKLRAEAHEHDSARPLAGDVRECLSTLMNHPAFDASERNRRFLNYVVEETLAGRAERIKAYTIALAAFDRSEDFDPLSDPIVRIEAGRLRRSLEHYYLTAGKADPIRIDIPKGHYYATFEFVDATPSPEARSAAVDTSVSTEPTPSPKQRKPVRWLAAAVIVLAVAGTLFYLGISRDGALAPGMRGPSVLVMPFDNVGQSPDRAYLSRGLTYEVIGNLTRFNDLLVYGPDTSLWVGRPDDGDQGPDVRPDYVLSGTVQTDNQTIRVSAVLAETETKRYLWSATIERNLDTSSLMEIQDEIGTQVAAAVAQPYGVVFERKIRAIATKPADSLASYECVVRFRQYWRSYSDQDFGSVRACLERAIADDPSYAQAYSSLALLYVDTYRFGFGKSDVAFDPLERANELASKAIALEPRSSDGYLASSMALWFLQNVDDSIATARQGLQINPYNTDLLADLGLRLAQRGRWDEAMPLIKEAYARNPAAPNGYHIATFLHEYMTGNYPAALEAALKVKSPAVIYGAVARAMVYAQLGEMAKAQAEVAEILRLDPMYGAHVRDDIEKRNHAPEITDAIIAGLKKAGLQTE